MATELTANTFDATVRPRAKRERPTWTLDGIGALIGTGPDFVKTIAAMDGSPIHEIGGRYFCYESELIEFIKGHRR